MSTRSRVTRVVAAGLGAAALAAAIMVPTHVLGKDRAPGGLSPGWNLIAPGGATTCARGTPYAFWVRPGRVDRLLIYFQGGGGCWDAATCAPGSTFFDDAVTEHDAPSGSAGVFQMNHPENPFRDHTFVFIPYCTGDVHWGNNVQTYRDRPGSEIVIHHKGFVNASTALRWVYTRFPSPRSVFITGCSAGSVGSIAFASYIIEQYPNARVAQLGDSLAFVFHRPVNLHTDYRAHDNFPSWIPELGRIRHGAFTMERFYRTVARFYPHHRFAQFNTVRDAVQIRFFKAVGGTEEQWEEALRKSLRGIQTAAPNFCHYLAGGTAHCVTPFDRFYTYRTNGVRLRNWAASLEAGTRAATIQCTRCDVAGEGP